MSRGKWHIFFLICRQWLRWAGSCPLYGRQHSPEAATLAKGSNLSWVSSCADFPWHLYPFLVRVDAGFWLCPPETSAHPWDLWWGSLCLGDSWWGKGTKGGVLPLIWSPAPLPQLVLQACLSLPQIVWISSKAFATSPASCLKGRTSEEKVLCCQDTSWW